MDKNDNLKIAEMSEKPDLSPCVCNATSCHFNGFRFGGQQGYCHLKYIQLNGKGQCIHFIDRDEAQKVFYK